MSKLKTLLVGAGGYGALYAGYLLSGEFNDLQLAGVADPYADRSEHYEKLKSSAPVYNDMADFFNEQRADLTIISTPIHLHYDQCITALKNGSHVLCEKPLVPTVSDLDRLQAAFYDSNKILAIGFQWCYSDVILAVKERILAGEFGKPKSFKSYVSWPRNWAYYSRGVNWAGKIKTAEGALVYDSVASNATAHYIQNMLFLLGSSMEESAAITDIKAECYRANDIESFDTIIFKGRANNADIFYTASHATNYTVSPVMDYSFESARIWLNVIGQEWTMSIHHNDGRIENLGPGIGEGEKNRLHFISKRIKGEQATLCTVDTVRPITVLIDMLFNEVPVMNFPSDQVVIDQQEEVTYVKNLHLDLWDCFQQNKLLSEFIRG